MPEELRDALAADAEARGMSMQQYLLDVLTTQGMAARNSAFLRSWEPVRGRYAGGIGPSTLEILAQERAERTQHLLDLASDSSP